MQRTAALINVIKSCWLHAPWSVWPKSLRLSWSFSTKASASVYLPEEVICLPLFSRIPTPVFLPGESQGRGSLVGCGIWGRTELDKTEWLHFHFSLSCIGEGNGNPLQCSCHENPRDGGAWWAAIYGVTRSRTWLKRLSSSSIYLKTFFEFV